MEGSISKSMDSVLARHSVINQEIVPHPLVHVEERRSARRHRRSKMCRFESMYWYLEGSCLLRSRFHSRISPGALDARYIVGVILGSGVAVAAVAAVGMDRRSSHRRIQES